MANEVHVAELADALQSVNGKFFRFRDGRGILPAANTANPNAEATTRGAEVISQGASGVADGVSRVLKDAAGSYAIRRVPAYGTDILVIRNAAQKTLTNGTSAQSPFTAANDTLTVEAATLYEFRCLLGLLQGTTSHTVAFSLEGTATYTNCAYYSEHISVTDATLASNDVDHKWTKAATATVITPAITATGSIIVIEGSFLTNAAGTVIPSITFSADPTGTCECHIGSYFKAWKLPSAAEGPWA